MIVLGVDVGTQGARALALDATGAVVAEARVAFAAPFAAGLPAGWREQDPRDWWAAVAGCLRQITTALGARVAEISGLAISATSGTVCALDADGEPLLPAIMYDDARGQPYVAETARALADLEAALGYRVNASFGLPKLVWLARERPAIMARARFLAHAGDALVGRLTGAYGVTDETQALKSGYDLLQRRWPDAIERALGVPLEKLPRVVRAGEVIGRVTAAAAAATGLPRGAHVFAGVTDGCAGQFAAGAAAPGEWVSVLGTTLVLKGVTEAPISDPAGRIYSHRHPDGYWLPGGASNVGGAALAHHFARRDLAALDRMAADVAPSGLLIYPLVGRGERFPFVRPDATAFVIGDASDEARLYAGYLEGVAYTERLAYDVVASLGAPESGSVATSGGGTRSLVWLQIRADILARELTITEYPEPAYGAALIAAAASQGARLSEVTRALIRIRQRVTPQPERARRYDEGYQRFLAACRERGWLDAPSV